MKDEILRAAIRATKRHGLKFTMDDIVRELHISKSSLYSVVKSKDGLVQEMVLAIMQQYSQEEQKILTSNKLTIEKLQELVSAYSAAFSKYNDAIFRDLQTFFPAVWEMWLKFQTEKVETFINLLEQGMSEGQIREVPAEIIQRCMVACLNAVNDYSFLERNNINYAGAVSCFIDMLFYGLAKK